MMRKMPDSQGEEVEVLEAVDLELWLARLVRQLGLWILGGVVAGAFTLGVTVTVLRAAIAANATEMERIDRDGSRPVKQLSKDVDSLRWEVRRIPERVVEEIENRRGARR